MPVPDVESAPFWQGLNEGKLMIQRCRSCGKPQHYMRIMCKHCWSRDLDVEQASGEGEVHSFTVVHQIGHPVLKEQAPFAILLVDLDEGPRVLARYDGDSEAVSIGDRVRATFPKVTPEQALLYFEGTE
jgi:uncharacterized OB-fold protein